MSQQSTKDRLLEERELAESRKRAPLRPPSSSSCVARGGNIGHPVTVSRIRRFVGDVSAAQDERHCLNLAASAGRACRHRIFLDRLLMLLPD
jgi:hypothetical protein